MQVVLMGMIGSGKTSLYNRITNSNEKEKQGGLSVTQNVFLKNAAYGRAPFKVLDTPGFGSSIKKIEHAAGIVAALSEGPINRIMVVLKLERLDPMKKNFMQIVSPINRFRPMISVLITHWDALKNQEEEEQNMKEIKELFMKYNINSFIFTSKQEHGSVTCEKILKEIENTQPSIVSLLATEYTSQFDLTDFQEDLEFEIENSKATLEVIFKRQAKTITNFIKNYPADKSCLGEVMHILTLESKEMADETIKKFEQDNWKAFSQMIEQGSQLAFMLHVSLKQHLEEYLKDIAKHAQEKMKAKADHCFNNIKKCPHCGQIWMKVQGCDYQTYCGAIPNSDNLLGDAAPRKWTVFWNKEKTEIMDVKENEEYKYYQKQLKEQVIKDNRSTLKIGAHEYSVGKLGCKNIIEWRFMVPLTPGELKELVDPGILDYYCKQDKEISNQMYAAQKPFEQQMLQAIELQKSLIIRNQ